MVKDQVDGGRRVLKMENGEDGGKIWNMDRQGKEDKVDKVDKEDSGHSGQGVATRRWAGVPDQVVPWGSRRGDLNEHGKWE